jgi:hypothetical protein
MKTIALAGALVVAASAALAQTAPLNFEQAVYVTCREAHAMNAEARKSLAVYLAEHSARYRGVVLPDGEHGAHIALLVRGGCTLAPDAYLFTVIDRAILAEKDRMPKRQ